MAFNWQERMPSAMWAMVAWEEQGKFLIAASNELGSAEINHELEYDYFLTDSWHDAIHPRHNRLEFVINMYSYVIVIGDSYAECISKLMDMGGPDQWGGRTQQRTPLPSDRQFPAPPPELGSGDG